MNVDGILHSFQQALARSGHELLIRSDPNFAGTLRLGELISGKVLRHFDGSRYLMQIGGEERVVDSAVPLRTDDIVHGRVIGLDDKVHLKRVYPRASDGGKPEPGVARDGPGLERTRGAGLDELLARHQVVLTARERAALMQLIEASSRPRLMSVAGLILAKIGISLDPSLARALYRALDSSSGARFAEAVETAPRLLAARDATPTHDDAAVTQLAALLRDAVRAAERNRPWADSQANPPAANPQATTRPASDEPRRSSGEARADTRARDEWQLGRLLLNAQGGGSVSHRLTSFPMWFGDRLVEVSLALFSQKDETARLGGIRHRRLQISIETESLGHVEFTVKAANRHLRVAVGAQSEAAASALARYLTELKAALGDAGWQVDQVDYATLTRDDEGGVVSSVVEHHISHDSLDRVM